MTSAHAAHGEASEANEGSDHVSDHVHQHDDDYGHNHLHDHGSPRQAGGPKSVYSAIEAMHRVIRYGFVELFDDIVWWLALGIVLSAVAQVTVPADLLMSMWGGGIVSMLLMLVLRSRFTTALLLRRRWRPRWFSRA